MNWLPFWVVAEGFSQYFDDGIKAVYGEFFTQQAAEDFAKKREKQTGNACEVVAVTPHFSLKSPT